MRKRGREEKDEKDFSNVLKIKLNSRVKFRKIDDQLDRNKH